MIPLLEDVAAVSLVGTSADVSLLVNVAGVGLAVGVELVAFA